MKNDDKNGVYYNPIYDSIIRSNKMLCTHENGKNFIDDMKKYPILYNSLYGGINMNKIVLNKWFDVNNTRYKVASIKKSVDNKHFDLIIYKDLSYLNMKSKVARLEVYFSQHENDYVMVWSGYDHGFTGELIDFINSLIKTLKYNLFLKDDGLEKQEI
ncbi:MAG: hypothetical protein M0R03_17415 [Novosphingobium sp.]|nr:hypothetical protein [Novosphingobium sp.]